jgi:glutamine synthetase
MYPNCFYLLQRRSLDYKTLFVARFTSVDDSVTDVCKYFDKNVKKVTATLGWEQENLLLIDRSLARSYDDWKNFVRSYLR